MDDIDFAKNISQKANRKLKAMSHPTGVWSGLGMMGLVGWSVVIPTLLGAVLGIWIDKHYPGSHAWTLALLIAGMTLGCANAWHWVSKQNDEIRIDASVTNVSIDKTGDE